MQVESSKFLEEKKPLLKELLKQLLAVYPYASILASDSRGMRYSVSKGGTNIAEDDMFKEKGYVIKVYDDASYGEYAFNDLREGNLADILTAVKEHLMPWKNALPKTVGVKQYPRLSDEKIEFEKSTEYEINPETMGNGAIIERITDLRKKVLDSDEAILDCQVGCNYQIYHKLFLSPNKDMTQNVMWMTGMMYAMASRGEEIKSTFKGYSNCGGAEVMDSMEQDIPKLVQTVKDLLISEPIVPGEYDCICTPEVTGMIVHEAFGHGVEMDMFVKKRALAEKYVGEYVASPLVTMHDGAAAAKETATFFFDDEGTVAQDTVIIDKGILKRGICDAQAGMALGSVPTGNGRRQSTDHKAYTRMTNTFFEPGKDKLEDMIASIEYGFLLQDATSGMEDPKNWGIQCMVSMAREIKDGKFTGKVFSPIVLTGYVPDLLKSITMMSDTVELGGGGFCGKGYKEWVKVSDGGPYIKARIRLG
ncbi:MAG: TldD/PmbA family protein [Roseburia sp.]